MSFFLPHVCLKKAIERILSEHTLFLILSFPVTSQSFRIVPVTGPAKIRIEAFSGRKTLDTKSEEIALESQLTSVGYQ